MEVKISDNYPSNTNAWDDLCLANSNLVQSTHFDKVQAFYKQKPIYIEIWENSQLVAGVKLQFWQSEKNFLTKKISKRLSQFGEIIFLKKEELNTYKKILQDAVSKIIKERKIVVYSIGNFYGNNELLVKPKLEPKTKNEFLTAYVNIDKSDEELLSSFNRNTRRNIKKAEESELSFHIINDIEDFLIIEKAVYDQQQGVKPPNFDYIRYMWNKIGNQYIVIGKTGLREKSLAGGFFYVYGESAFSVFGGAVKNDLGAGHYFYFKLMKHLRDKGIKKFYFGQIAKEIDKQNEKFSIGITNFKRGFRCVEVEAEKNQFVNNIYKKKFFEVIIKIYSYMKS